MPVTNNVNFLGVKWTTGRVLEARIFQPFGGSVALFDADFAMTETPAGSGQYIGRATNLTFPDSPLDAYEWEAREVTAPGEFDASNIVAAPRRELGRVVAGRIVRYGDAAEVAAVLAAAHGAGSWLTPSAAVQVTGSATAGTTLAVSDDIEMATADSFDAAFTLGGVDSTGWTGFAFIVKMADSDDDDEALLVITASNPGAAEDGLVFDNGQPVAADDRARASITVGTVAPDTGFVVHIDPAAVDIPPSPSGSPWRYEIVRWNGAQRRRLGAGNFAAARSLWRAPTPPGV